MFPLDLLPHSLVIALGVLATPWLTLRTLRYTLREGVLLYAFARRYYFDRRRVADRRAAQIPFDGPERRSGCDRRSLVVAA